MFAVLNLIRLTSKQFLPLTIASLLAFLSLSAAFRPANAALAQSVSTPETLLDPLLQEGLSLLSKAQNQMALAKFQQALQVYQSNGDRLGEAHALNGIGDAQYSLKKYQSALESYSKAWNVYESLGDRKNAATVLNNIGAVYDDLKQYADALNYYTQALALRQQAGDLAGEGTTRNNLAGIYLNQGNFERSLKEYNAALKVRWMLGDRRGEATTLNNIGFVCRSTAQFLQNQGDVEKSREWYQSALDHYLSSLAIRRMLGDRMAEAATLNNIGFVYRSLAQYPTNQPSEMQRANLKEAQQTYTKSAEIYGQLGDRKGQATVLNNLGNVYFSLGQYEDALKSYNQALLATRVAADLPEQATTLSNIAFVYRTQADAAKPKEGNQEANKNSAPGDYQNHYARALEHYKQALAIIRKVGDLKSEAATLNNIGGILIITEEYPEALKVYQDALALYEKLEDLPGQATTRYNIGVTYARQEKYREALNSYKRAKLIYEQLRDRTRQSEIRSVIQAIESQQKAI